MHLIPLTTNPIGWLILGLGGYALYKAGKKKGEEESVPATGNSSDNNTAEKAEKA